MQTHAPDHRPPDHQPWTRHPAVLPAITGGALMLATVAALRAAPHRFDMVIAGSISGAMVALAACLVASLLGARIRSAAALRRNQEKLLVTLRSIGDGVIATDAESRISQINPVAERLTGWKQSLAAGRPLDVVFRLIDKTTRQPLVSPFEQVMRAGSVVEMPDDALLVARGGDECPVAYTASPIQAALPGRPEGVVIVFRDQTRERRAAIELAETNERLALATQSAQIGVWDLDIRQQKLSWNDEMYGLYAINRDDTSPRIHAWSERLDPSDLNEVMAAMEKSIQNPTEQHYFASFRVNLPDGGIRYLQRRARIFRDAAGQPTRIIGVDWDVTATHLAEEQLRQAARTDKLTGLANRWALQERLEQAVSAALAGVSPGYCVLFLDFDQFKLVNDSLGHDAGDKLLVQAGERIAGALAPQELSAMLGTPVAALAARLGGDEFVLLLDGCGCSHAASRIAETVRLRVSAPYSVNGHEVHCSASIGIATSLSRHRSADDVLRDADTAMYEAKRRGKNRHAVFDPAMGEIVRRRVALETEMRKAVERGQLVLHYQPIYNLDDATLVGFEALLRWLHPERGLVSPAEFIPIAEETGLICDIGTWVLEEASRQAARWREMCGHDLTINVNLSRRQLMDENAAQRILQAVVQAGARPEWLKLEVTESAIMQNIETVTAALRELRGHGFALCMDDFGTGHSSLSCLSKFTIDVLKIDKSFIREMTGTRAFSAVVYAIVTLAHNLNLRVVAEGIEHDAQLAQLQAMGCDEGQGFLFAKPLAVADAESLLMSVGRKPPTPAIDLPAQSAA
jgi:diguanylate cyclase (GGDEF)-like protein/PAS domain S-box-containing protein